MNTPAPPTTASTTRPRRPTGLAYFAKLTAPSIPEPPFSAVLDPSLGGRFAKEAKADFTVGRDSCRGAIRGCQRTDLGALGLRSARSRPFLKTSPTCRLVVSHTRRRRPHGCCYLSKLPRSSPPSAPKPGLSFLPRLLPADPLPPLLSGSATSAPTISALAPGVVGADPPPCWSVFLRILLTSHLRRAICRLRMVRRPFSIQPRLRLPDHAPNEGGVTSRVSKAGSLHRRFG